MKIVLLNTSYNKGGAAIACFRLLKSLQLYVQDVIMLVQQENPHDKAIKSTTTSFFKKKINFFRFIFERLIFLCYEKSKEIRFAFSIANTGEHLKNNKLIKEADIIHLHWINQGFLSIKGIKSLSSLSKPIVWTLHDMWSFTGGCHYSGTCNNYLQTCGNCSFLKFSNPKDLSNKIFRRKKNLFEKLPIHFVTCSAWLAAKAKESALLKNSDISVIPNPIDTELFKPKNKEINKIRASFGLPNNKKLILFGAANINDKRKGIDYLYKSIELLILSNKISAEDINLVVFGKSNSDLKEISGITGHNLSILTSQQRIADLYGCVDLFILPSLEDNLPNTVMEALSCGTPVVAFNYGGIPEMVEHKINGYLATYKSANDLAEGIQWILEHKNYNEISEKARQKVLNNFTMKIVANQYIDLYKKLLA